MKILLDKVTSELDPNISSENLLRRYLSKQFIALS